jgi:hypothetical protein
MLGSFAKGCFVELRDERVFAHFRLSFLSGAGRRSRNPLQQRTWIRIVIAGGVGVVVVVVVSGACRIVDADRENATKCQLLHSGHALAVETGHDILLVQLLFVGNQPCNLCQN